MLCVKRRLTASRIDQGRHAHAAFTGATVPVETNFLLSPAHQDLRRMYLGDPSGFRFDRRLPKTT